MTVGWHPPLINFRREYKEHGSDMLTNSITRHFEVPLHAKVKIGWLACFNSTTAILIFICTFGWATYVEKTYLKKVTVDGVARVQMRHPLKGDCDALDENCPTAFADTNTLAYCNQTSTSRQSCKGNICPCRYLDEYDINQESDAEQRHVFLPTRYSKFQHDIRCFDDCEHRYDINWEDTHFVADIDHFTLRIDHTFIARGLELEKGQADCMGFVRFCYPKARVDDEEKCGVVPIPGSGGHLEEKDIKALEAIYEEGELPWPEEHSTRTLLEEWAPNPAVRTTLKGDKIDLFRALQLLNVTLDGYDEHGGKGWGDEESLRRLGFVFVIDIKYHNWKEKSLPNSLPPVYIIGFNVLSNNEYKVTSTHYTDPNTRIVDDAHGILVTVKQGGNIGKFHLRSMVMIFVEVSVLIGLGKFFVICLGINCCFSDVHKAEEFENGIHPPVNAGNESMADMIHQHFEDDDSASEHSGSSE